MEKDLVKIVILGESGVGKSTILQMYINEEYDSTITPSLANVLETIDIEIQGNDKTATILDIAGQGNYIQNSRELIQGASAIIIVFDLTNRQSFIKAQEIQRACTPKTTFLVGNKNDLINDRAIGNEELSEYLNKCPPKYMEITATSLDQVSGIFNAAFYANPNEEITKTLQKPMTITESQPSTYAADASDENINRQENTITDDEPGCRCFVM